MFIVQQTLIQALVVMHPDHAKLRMMFATLIDAVKRANAVDPAFVAQIQEQYRSQDRLLFALLDADASAGIKRGE